jgi:hypothetical protein
MDEQTPFEKVTDYEDLYDIIPELFKTGPIVKTHRLPTGTWNQLFVILFQNDKASNVTWSGPVIQWTHNFGISLFINDDYGNF